MKTVDQSPAFLVLIPPVTSAPWNKSCADYSTAFRESGVQVWLRIFLNGADAQYVAAFREFVQVISFDSI